MTYSEKLKDPRWQKKRLQILNRDRFSCQLCGDNQTSLHVHHKSYKQNPWDSEEDELITYCEHCHLVVEYYKNEHFDFSPAKVFKFNTGGFIMIYVLNKAENGKVHLFSFEFNIATESFELTNGIISEVLDKIIKEVKKIKKSGLKSVHPG